MKDSMSALDLRAIASEFQSLLQSRVKKCYQPHYEQIVLRLNRKVRKVLTWLSLEVHEFI